MIPFLDLKPATDELRAELDEAYRRFMDSGWYVLGDEVTAFEREYAAYCEAEHCVGVGTGLDALILALRALDVGPGDEVIVPSNTYIATWLAVTQVGATIVPVEPDVKTFNIDPSCVAAAVTSKTKVILAVNLYGQPVDYDALQSIATDCNASLVIDNAQAHGARYKNRRVGGIAEIECHSFYPSKNMGAYGEAGAITTNHADIADRVAVLRNYGSRVRYYNEVCGTNSRLDALQAAFLRVKLKHVDAWNDRRRAIAQLYLDSLAPLATDDLADNQQSATANAAIVLPFVPSWAEPVWHLFVIRWRQRDSLRKQLEQSGIGTQVHYPVPPHRSDAYRQLGVTEFDLPIAVQLAEQVLSLPMGPHLAEADAMKVVQSLESIVGASR